MYHNVNGVVYFVVRVVVLLHCHRHCHRQWHCHPASSTGISFPQRITCQVRSSDIRPTSLPGAQRESSFFGEGVLFASFLLVQVPRLMLAPCLVQCTTHLGVYAYLDALPASACAPELLVQVPRLLLAFRAPCLVQCKTLMIGFYAYLDALPASACAPELLVCASSATGVSKLWSQTRCRHHCFHAHLDCCC